MDDLVMVVRKKAGEGPTAINEGVLTFELDGEGPFEVPRWCYEKWLRDTFDVEE